MIRLFNVCMCLMALAVVAFAPALVQAEDTLKVAVLDTKYIMNKSKAAQSIRKQLDAERKAFLKKVEEREKKLRADGEALSKKKDSLSKEDFLEKRKVFDSNLLEANKRTKKDNLALERAFAVATKTLEEELVKVVGDISAEEGYTLVFRRNDVFLVAKTVDITKRVLKALDKKVTNIAFEVKD